MPACLGFDVSLQPTFELTVHTLLSQWTGDTALIIAATRGSAECVNTLIEAGACLNTGDKVRCCHPIPVVVTPGLIRPPTQDNFTALMAAVRYSHLTCVDLLLKAGADHSAKETEVCCCCVRCRIPAGLQCGSTHKKFSK